jgi:acetyl esterase/lipase
MKDADDGESSQAIETDATLYVTPTGFVTTSFGGETALSLTRQLAASITTPAMQSAANVRARIRSVLGVDELSSGPLSSRILGQIRKPNYRAEYFELTSDREIRIPGWLLTPDNANASTPTVVYLGEGATWGAVAEEAFAERLCARGGCRVVAIDVRGRGDLAIAYPERGRFYFPNRITNEGYLTWFTLWLGKPLVGGQVFDVLRALEYLRSRADVPGDNISLMGDGPHGVIALYAGALDDGVRRVALRQTILDYRSLATAERYTQPFGIYAYGLLREFDLPQVASALAPRPMLFVNPVGPTGEPAGPEPLELYKASPNVTIRLLASDADPVQFLAGWMTGS